MLSSVRGFHRYLLDEELVETDVAATTKPPKLPSRLPKAISIEQMAQVIAAAGTETPQQLRDTALLELLYATGARISEAVDLNVDDVIEGDVIRLFGKGGKQRIVPLGSYARAAIDAFKATIELQRLQRRLFRFAVNLIYALMALLGFLTWLRNRDRKVLFWMSAWAFSLLLSVGVGDLRLPMTNLDLSTFLPCMMNGIMDFSHPV